MPTAELDTLEDGQKYLTATLTFTGLDEEQLRNIQPAVENGLKDVLRVQPEYILFTDYRDASSRRLQGPDTIYGGASEVDIAIKVLLGELEANSESMNMLKLSGLGRFADFIDKHLRILCVDFACGETPILLAGNVEVTMTDAEEVEGGQAEGQVGGTTDDEDDVDSGNGPGSDVTMTIITVAMMWH